VTWAKANDTSFYKMLIDLYVKHGLYREKLVSLVKKGISGAEEINHIMKELRENPMKTINGEKVVQIDDYKTSKSMHLATGETEDIEIPKSNVLIYHTEAGSRIAARPSGTEPKIKFYISVNQTLDKASNYEKINQKLDDKINGIIKELGV